MVPVVQIINSEDEKPEPLLFLKYGPKVRLQRSRSERYGVVGVLPPFR